MAAAVSMSLRRVHWFTFRLREAEAARVEAGGRWLALISNGAGETERAGNWSPREKQEPLETWTSPPTVDSSRSRNPTRAAPLLISGLSTGNAPAFQTV